MTTEEIILATINIICAIGILYFIFQIVRNQAIFNIRINWINTEDSRWGGYTYEQMLTPNLNNWFGLKYPKDKHFK